MQMSRIRFETLVPILTGFDSKSEPTRWFRIRFRKLLHGFGSSSEFGLKKKRTTKADDRLKDINNNHIVNKVYTSIFSAYNLNKRSNPNQSIDLLTYRCVMYILCGGDEGIINIAEPLISPSMFILPSFKTREDKNREWERGEAFGCWQWKTTGVAMGRLCLAASNGFGGCSKGEAVISREKHLGVETTCSFVHLFFFCCCYRKEWFMRRKRCAELKNKRKIRTFRSFRSLNYQNTLNTI